MSEKFDPKPYLIELPTKKGPAPYLEVKNRILWLTKEYPNASVETSFVGFTPDGAGAVCHARVSIPDPDAPGGVRVGEGLAMHEATTVAKDFAANASTSAIGRALAMIGIGTQFALEDFAETRDAAGNVQPVDSPTRPPQRQPAPPQAQPQRAMNPANVSNPASPAQLRLLFALGVKEFPDKRDFYKWRGPEEGIAKGEASKVIEFLKNREDAGQQGTGGLPSFNDLAGRDPLGVLPPEDDGDELPF